ncbi:uncharacterized protein LOC143018661 [Oratosquilla oratoria]|uniref:uncharacterized protein LOC143018661 n=1 Tax=Oratosquilla oratoria TaxID=337810 RepID=UPI003F763138
MSNNDAMNTPTQQTITAPISPTAAAGAAGPSSPMPPHSTFSAVVAICPPQFDESSPARWFLLLEAQFCLSNVTVPLTKFYHALSHLPNRVLNQLYDDVVNSGYYERLKKALTDVLTRSPPELFDALVHQNNIMYDKPATLLRELRTIGKQLGVDDDFIRLKFLRAVPSYIRPLLVTHAGPLDELAHVAETFMAHGHGNKGISVSSVNKPVPRAPHSDSAPVFRSGNPTTRGSASTTSSIGLTPFYEGQRQRVCRYHIFYGNSARSCKMWCILPSTSDNVLPSSRPNLRPNSRPPSPGPQLRTSGNSMGSLPTVVPLTNASGYAHSYEREVDVEFGIQRIRRSFPWSFVVADVVRPVLETDFLITKALIVDCRNRNLLDPFTGCTIPLASDVTTSSHAMHYGNIDSKTVALLSELHVLTAPTQLSNTQPLEGTICHRIDTGDSSPVSLKTRPLTGENLKAAKDEFQFLFNAGIIGRSNSPWGVPISFGSEESTTFLETLRRLPSETLEEHIYDIQTVSSILAKNNMRLSLNKCKFFKSELTFLGYEISSKGIKPPKDRATAISNFPLPQTSQVLCRFMGMINFFRPMIPNFATVAYSLTELLKETLIDGHTVTLFLDHKPLVTVFHSKSLAKTDRQQRQLSVLSEYVSTVEYIRGDNNVVADCLSRTTCAVSLDVFDLSGIGKRITNWGLSSLDSLSSPYPLI